MQIITARHDIIRINVRIERSAYLAYSMQPECTGVCVMVMLVLIVLGLSLVTRAQRGFLGFASGGLPEEGFLLQCSEFGVQCRVVGSKPTSSAFRLTSNWLSTTHSPGKRFFGRSDRPQKVEVFQIMSLNKDVSWRKCPWITLRVVLRRPLCCVLSTSSGFCFSSLCRSARVSMLFEHSTLARLRHSAVIRRALSTFVFNTTREPLLWRKGNPRGLNLCLTIECFMFFRAAYGIPGSGNWAKMETIAWRREDLH